MELICNFQDTFSKKESFLSEELQQHISKTVIHENLDFAKHLKESSLS